MLLLFYSPSPVQVGFCFTNGCPRAGRGSEEFTDSQSAEKKYTRAPQPETRGGEQETETRTTTHHCRVNTNTQNTQQPGCSKQKPDRVRG